MKPSTMPLTNTDKQEREIRETEVPWSEYDKQEKPTGEKDR
jgi:hypothetical protein